MWDHLFKARPLTLQVLYTCTCVYIYIYIYVFIHCFVVREPDLMNEQLHEKSVVSGGIIPLNNKIP